MRGQWISFYIQYTDRAKHVMFMKKNINMKKFMGEDDIGVL